MRRSAVIEPWEATAEIVVEISVAVAKWADKGAKWAVIMAAAAEIVAINNKVYYYFLLFVFY